MSRDHSAHPAPFRAPLRAALPADLPSLSAACPAPAPLPAEWRGLLPVPHAPARPPTAPAVAAAAPVGLFVLGGIVPAAPATFAATTASGPRTDGHVDQAMRGDLARAQYGVTGAGIKVGILSDSFNARGGMATDVARGDLPAGVRILEEGAAGGRDEGRAMADIVHAIAPGAQIMFHTATSGEADFAAGITALQQAGCTVIVDDVAYLDEPFFQDGGVVQTAVEHAVAAGVSYFTAASNEGQDFIQQSFQGMPVVLQGLPRAVTAQNFGSHAAPQPWANIVVPTGGVVQLDMQWDQPFASIGGGHGSADSLGMALYDAAGHLVANAAVNATGGDPDQILAFTNTTAGTAFRLVVYANGGAAPPGLFKIINYGNGSISGCNVGQGSGTVIGHEMVTGGNTVGAMAWSSAPRFHGNNTAESFSSVGTGNILFDSHGNRLATPQTPGKVDFLGADGGLTSVFAPFYGTSAAAPAAAAVAALVLQAEPWLTPAQVSGVLAASATPASGAAHATGAGLIQADAALRLALALHH